MVNCKNESEGGILDTLIDDSRDDWTKGEPLYSGAHMVNDPFWNTSKEEIEDIQQIRLPKKVHNDFWYRRIEFYSTDDINAGDKIMIKYDGAVINKGDSVA